MASDVLSGLGLLCIQILFTPLTALSVSIQIKIIITRPVLYFDPKHTSECGVQMY